jgi:GR25 family glycosyltransferase involved in LPS biosynthesis
MKSISDIKHAFYINLDTRPDRKSHVEKQLETIGIQAQRFNAIKLKNGALGCSMSHLKCLETAKQNNWDHVVIVEDDILFTKPDLFKKQLSFFFKNHDNFDVILLAGNNASRDYIKVDHSCVKVYNCQTTTGYLVKSHYYDTLIQNYKDGIQKLLKEPENHKLYAIDKYWFQLQEKDDWYLIVPLSVVQREDYSDIEKRPTNYTHIMLDLDKPWLMQNKPLQQLLPMANEIKKPSKKISMALF